MRKFVAIVAAVLVAPAVLVGGTATASAAADFPPSPRECSPSYQGLLAGEAVAVFCDFGPTQFFRVFAECESGFNRWREFGTIAATGYETSVAECRGGLLSTAHVVGYRVDWV
ncbi:MAG: hypothetical protein ABIQ18_00920 [Umezawaea sp.]